MTICVDWGSAYILNVRASFLDHLEPLPISKKYLRPALFIALLLSVVPAWAGLIPRANVLPSDVHNTASGAQYCQMCQYADRPATIAAYGKLHDEAFWKDLEKLQAIQKEHQNFGFFGQVFDSTDSAAIQAEAKKHGITFPLVYSVDPDWEKIYQVGGVSRTVYYSEDFKILWSGVGIDDAALATINSKIKANPQG